MYRHPGTPRSRAKDHSIRDAAAMIPMSRPSPTRRINATMTALPPLDFVACTKIAMKGYEKLVSEIVFGSPRQNRAAMIVPKPIAPFIIRPKTIDRGTTLVAFLISSLI